MSQKPIPTHVTIDGSVEVEPVAARPPLRFTTPQTGPMIAYQGTVLFVGEHTADGASAIMLVAGKQGCRCGCGASGAAFANYLSPEQARTAAAQLNEFAERFEKAAAEAADALFNKVRGK